MAWSYGFDPCLPERWSYRPFFSVPASNFGDHEGKAATELVSHWAPERQPYLQDLSLWADVADDIRAYFAPSALAHDIASHIKGFWELPRPVLSVQVRRGDNANDPLTPNKWEYHPLRPLSYYRETIEQLRPQVASVACFGDDPEWNRQNIPADWYSEVTPRPKENEPGYWDGPIDWIDLLLQRECDRHIIANSTFGWWGAWLSNDPAPVYPWPWFGPRLSMIDASLMMPKSWVRYEHEVWRPGTP